MFLRTQKLAKNKVEMYNNKVITKIPQSMHSDISAVHRPPLRYATRRAIRCANVLVHTLRYFRNNLIISYSVKRIMTIVKQILSNFKNFKMLLFYFIWFSYLEQFISVYFVFMQIFGVILLISVYHLC